VDRVRLLLAWEATEEHSWNPVLAELLRADGFDVAEAHTLDDLDALDLSRIDLCLPRFRVGAANMTTIDEVLVGAGVPMLNGRDVRRRCENKALAHLAFARAGIAQPPSFVVSADGDADRDMAWEGETLLKPLYGCRGGGIEIFPSFGEALARASARREDLLVQQMIWPARCWRVAVGRTTGVIDPYWRRPPTDEDRILSISTGSQIVREGYSDEIGAVAMAMLEAVGGDVLAVDLLEAPDGVYALEINHNFDAHGGDEPAAAAFAAEILRAVEERRSLAAA
jgi:glutathione synthase/RimK-type ligase-like ATP-grasp enzyme